jgi:mannose-1-phosphate guanylyltransferase
MRAVVLAGGGGTRLRPLTDTLPKPMLPFMGAPFAAGLLRRLAAAGFDDVTFLVGRDAESWVGLPATVVTEETPLDTAGAARRLLRDARGEAPVLVCNGDVLTDLDYGALVAAHHDAGAVATIALTRVADTSSFGVVVCDPDGRVEQFVEKPPPGTLDADTVNAGTYVLAPDAFAEFPGDGPLSFERDVFPGLLSAGRRLLGVAADAYWQDLGTPARYLDGHRAVLEGRCAWPLGEGMRLVAGRAAVHDSAEVADGSDLGANVVVGAGCVIEGGARLADAVLHERVRVGEEAQVRRAVLGEGAVVGEAAVVGPDAVLAAGQVVAAFQRIP